MKKGRAGLFAGAVLVLAAATAWGLGISVVASQPAVVRSELPNTGFESQQGKARIVTRANWGADQGELGVTGDGDAWGPQSFDVDDRGRIYVLDNVNSRVVRFVDGNHDAEFRLPGRDFEDIVVARDRIAVLCRTGDRRVVLFDAQAGAIGTLTISAQVPDVYRLFVVEDSVVVECPSPMGRTYHSIGTLDGMRTSDATQLEPREGGAPSASGASVTAAKLTDNDITADVVADDMTAKIRLRSHSDRDISAILDATTDQRGNVYITYGLVRSATGVDPKPGGRLVVARYASSGELSGRIETRDDFAPEPFRKFTITESGAIYQLAPDSHGVSVIQWTMDQ